MHRNLDSRRVSFPLPLRSLTVALLHLALAAAPLSASDPGSPLSCLKPLETPTLDSAKASVRMLKQLAASTAGPERESAEQLATVVQTLFGAEYRLSQAKAGLAKAEESAQKREEKARAWLKPSSFGTSRRNLYDNEVRAAKDMLERAGQAVGAARAQLALAVQELSAYTGSAAGSGQADLAAILDAAAETVAARSLEIAEPDSLSSDEFASQLLGLALLGLVAAGLMSAADSPNQVDSEQKRWADANTAAENGRRWFERANFHAESRGEAQPYPGYDSRP